jgi:hypothetical protein
MSFGLRSLPGVERTVDPRGRRFGIETGVGRRDTASRLQRGGEQLID